VDGEMWLAVQGTPGASCVVEATSDFTTWTPVATNTLAWGSMVIDDPESKGLARRYYRAVAR